MEISKDFEEWQFVDDQFDEIFLSKNTFTPDVNSSNFPETFKNNYLGIIHTWLHDSHVKILFC